MGKVSGFVLPVVMALVVLVYTTLAVLTLTTASADSKFADRNILFNQKYYQAQGEFARTYAALDTLLAEVDAQALESDAILTLLQNKFEDIQMIEKGDTIVFEYIDSVTENTIYCADMHYQFGENLVITAEGIVNISDWEEEYYELWGG